MSRSSRKPSSRSHPFRITGLIVFLLLVAAVTSAGCIRLIQQSSGTGDPADTDVLQKSGLPQAAVTQPGPGVQAAPVQDPALSDKGIMVASVSEAAPILIPELYPSLHATRLNQTGNPPSRVPAPFFKKTYPMRGNATGLIVMAPQGPLVIMFDVRPVADCIEDPKSCRGDTIKPVNRPYFTLTVRDHETNGIVAEDGYGREFSSEKSNRTLKVYRDGRFHLTLTGNFLDVTLAVAAGGAQNRTAASVPASVTPGTNQTSPDMLEHLRQIGAVL